MEMVGIYFILEFYYGRSIFIIGVIGFMGKVFVEKLLRLCLGIKNVYIFIRLKRGKDVSQRLEELFVLKVNINFVEDYFVL